MTDKKILLKNIFFTILYAIFTLILVLHHEIWADEAQVWMLAKYLSIPELFKHLVNEGHPSLFYLLMMPFAKTGMSIFCMQFVCWISTVISVFLLLQYSPFSKGAKLAIITSAGFLYFFPVLARTYSVLPMLVFFTAILYPKSEKHPFLYSTILFITANIHVIMLGFVGILGCIFAYDNIIKPWKQLQKTEKQKYISAVFIVFLGMFLVWLQLHGTTSSNAFIKYDFGNIISNTFSVTTKFFVDAYDARFSDTFEYLTISNTIFCILIVSIILYITLFVILFKTNKKMFLIALCGVGFQFVVYILAYNYCVYVSRIFCAHIIVLFALWYVMNDKNTTEKTKKVINITLILFLIITLFNGIKYSLWDMLYNYSAAKPTAEFVEKNINKENSIIITDNIPYCMSLIYYLDGKYDIYSALTKKSIKYIVWDKTMYHFLSEEGWDDYMQYMKTVDKEFLTKKLYVVLPTFQKYMFDVNNLKNFKKIYESKDTVLKFEGYRIYEYTSSNK